MYEYRIEGTTGKVWSSPVIYDARTRLDYNTYATGYSRAGHDAGAKGNFITWPPLQLHSIS